MTKLVRLYQMRPYVSFRTCTSVVPPAKGWHENSRAFAIEIGLHQGSAMKSLRNSKDNTREVPWDLLYSDVQTAGSITKEVRECSLTWTDVLEHHGLRVSRDKTDYDH